MAQAPSPFRQPRAVYAVGFACVISFMGIGLVDPILPALASRLNATVRPALDAADAAEAGADVEAGADGQPGPVPVAGPVLMAQAGQSATVTSVPLTVTTAAGVDASRQRV